MGGHMKMLLPHLTAREEIPRKQLPILPATYTFKNILRNCNYIFAYYRNNPAAQMPCLSTNNSFNLKMPRF